MIAYAATRSARANAIDRSRTAGHVYGSFNREYASSPNRSDVRGYDTLGNK
ncbi:hypothetical protein HYU14_01930 [Candidatus Woesearchaeota archaeon]|nr:hypothetical protein [Candidatus Woesearchaeota archaeon]